MKNFGAKEACIWGTLALGAVGATTMVMQNNVPDSQDTTQLEGKQEKTCVGIEKTPERLECEKNMLHIAGAMKMTSLIYDLFKEGALSLPGHPYAENSFRRVHYAESKQGEEFMLIRDDGLSRDGYNTVTVTLFSPRKFWKIKQGEPFADWAKKNMKEGEVMDGKGLMIGTILSKEVAYVENGVVVWVDKTGE